ncbi:hypothetical protein SAMN02745194_04522 [Roseomonas rosea]|uniref:Uncharacterized protein n=1 Tax=Muricoccus roseus TaxID=198092 RepID=A0A1M6QUD8_9PROT|nr:hypothetical protein [Roseomonas rosea]SHK23871.1 hypothetical protein SAMN02745194_04522 [Roseomonas rosea]
MTPALSEDQAPFFDPAIRDEPHIREALDTLERWLRTKDHRPPRQLAEDIRYLMNTAFSRGVMR